MSKLRVFVPIRKVDEENRLVYGTITEEVMDKSGEVMDYASSKPLFEKWSQGIASATDGKSLGNVRVMHTAKAAGKLTDIVFLDEDRRIEAAAKIVDDDEWEKVKEGVYTGFSIGGRYAKRWKDGDVQRFTADPVEVSLVDNPCVPTAHFSMVKANGAEEQVAFKLWQPSNEDVAAKATELAKVSNGNWVDFLEQAREDLIKAKAEEDEEDAEEESEEEKDEEEDEDDNSSAKSDDADEDADKVTDCDPSDKPKVKAKKGSTDAEDDAAAKAAVNEVEQVWKTTDGRTFAKKAEAVTHQATLDAQKTANPLTKAIAGLKGALSGESAPADGEADAQRDAIITVGADVTKWHGILTKAREVFGEHCLAKGLYTVGRLAELMESLGYVCSSACWERQTEGDNSPVPEMIANGLVQLGGALVAMAQEEVSEMIMEMQDRGLDIDTIITTAPEMVELSAAVTMTKASLSELEKVGSRHSKTDKEKLKEMYRLLRELGVGDDEEDDDKTEKLAKFAGIEAENAELKKVISDAVPVIEQLKKDVELLKSAPMPSAPRGNVVTKEGDRIGIEPDADPQNLEQLVEKFGADALATAAIKLAHRRPVHMGGGG